jgi:hypothetical protein
MAEEAGGTEAPIYSELRGWKIHEDVPSSVELRWRPGEHQAALTL